MRCCQCKGECRLASQSTFPPSLTTTHAQTHDMLPHHWKI